jgi:hypothetical protein
LKSLKDVKPGDKIFVLNSNRNSIKVDDITYSQMKAIFDILGIDTEEVIK